jgi:tripartite-type tricarboxylate transporter receptor subunit TctC
MRRKRHVQHVIPTFLRTTVSPEIVRRMHAEIIKALATPEVGKFLAEADYFPIGNSPDEFTEFLRKDLIRQAEIAKRIGVQPQ